MPPPVSAASPGGPVSGGSISGGPISGAPASGARLAPPLREQDLPTRSGSTNSQSSQYAAWPSTNPFSPSQANSAPPSAINATVPGSPPTPRAPSAPRRLNYSNESVSNVGLVGSSGTHTGSNGESHGGDSSIDNSTNAGSATTGHPSNGGGGGGFSQANEGSDGALAVPRTPSRSTHRSHSRTASSASQQRTPSASASARATSVSRRAVSNGASDPHPHLPIPHMHTPQATAQGASVHAAPVSQPHSAHAHPHSSHTHSSHAHSSHAHGSHAHSSHAHGSHGHSSHHRKVQKRTSIGPWDFVKSIGAGSMGQVKLAVNRYTKQPAAVKIVPKAFTMRSKDGRETNESKDARVVREAAIGSLLSHPNISKLYDVYSMTGHFYLVFEFIAGGQMLDYIIAHGCVKEAQARRFARSIASALDYCHQNSIVHRDLKIENILIADNGDVKLIDFGLSNLFRRTDLLRTFCGSLYFAAPELLNASPYTGPEIDVWSFGVVLYVLVCGKVPFEDKSMTVLHSKIKRGTVEYPSWLSSQCVDLLRHMLTVNPDKRYNLSEVCNHPWMLKGYDGPPDNYVPRRTPLTIDSLDPAVINEMERLGIGQASQLEHALRTVLVSPDYLNAVDMWFDRQQIDLAAASSNETAYSMELDSISPINAFSPEISCYFLTRERMERYPAQQQQIQQQIEQQQLQEYQQQLPSIPQPPSISVVQAPSESDELSEIKVGRTRARTVGGADIQKHAPVPQFHHPRPANTSTEASSRVLQPTSSGQQQALQIPQPAFVSNVMQQAQVGVVTAAPQVKSIEITPNGAVPVPEEPHQHRVFSQPLPNRRSRSNSSSSSNYSQSSRQFHVSQQATQNHTQLQPVQSPPKLQTPQTPQSQSTQPSQPMSLFRKLSLRKSKPSGHTRAKSTNHAHDMQTKPFSEEEEIPPNSMPSIESPKQVFFRGIFSVNTTSTKPLREIRAEIIRVLNLKHIEFVEVKGGFACVARPNQVMRQLSSASGAYTPQREGSSSGSSNNAPNEDMLRTPNRFADQSLNTMLLSPSTPPSTPRNHRRKVSENGVLSPAGSMGGSVDSIDMEIGASDMLGANAQKSSIPVRFEIDIVRVPIVALHGIQFKKMTGNVWMYKNIAQDIIEDLRI